ncbi:hypothetical protein CPC08DRAFT_729024 [Agrocybe pediades]|nr:hypothetical protein CPC08DRAFT_729024 [Agrocybe pediades]
MTEGSTVYIAPIPASPNHSKLQPFSNSACFTITIATSAWILGSSMWIGKSLPAQIPGGSTCTFPTVGKRIYQADKIWGLRSRSVQPSRQIMGSRAFPTSFTSVYSRWVSSPIEDARKQP